MKKAMKFIGAVIATLFTISSCTDPKGTAADVDAAPDYVVSESVDTTPVVGMVVDPTGTPLAGVLVVTGADSAITSENGLYAFEKKRSVNGRGVVKFEKNGYFSVVRTAQGERLDAVLQPMEDKDSVATVTRFKSTEATTLKVGGMTVSIPANSLVDEKGRDYSGYVSASVFYLDPNSKNFNEAMPGGDMSAVTANGKDVVLLSYGMTEVTLADSTGGKLQLKKGAESEMTFPVPAGFDDKLHPTIPLWYFDEAKGTWVEEGVAEKVDGCYKGKVQHFSWHNLDVPSVRAYIEGYVRNEKGEPLPNIRVTVSQTYGYTNAEGHYKVVVPKNTPVFVMVRPVDYGGKTNLPIYQVKGLKAGDTYQQDVVLPNAACIKGRVTNTEGRGIYTIVTSLSRSRVNTNFNGDYTLYLPGDEPITVTVLSEDYCDQKGIDMKVKPYIIEGESSIKPDFSYDFVLPTRRYSRGRLTDENGIRLNDVKVTANIDGVEYTTYSYWGRYSFYYLEAKKATVGVKSADYYGYKEKFYNAPSQDGTLKFPDIVLPSGQIIRGRVVNTCGPSRSSVTLVYGGFLKKKREAYTVNTDAFGKFEIQVPVDRKKESKQLRIKCRNKMKKVKLNDSESNTLDLGNIEICTDFKLEDNCVYAEIDDKILKFDLSKDRYNEMLKSEGNKVKHQIWCKTSDYAGFLVLNVDGSWDMPKTQKANTISDAKYSISSYSVYLVTPNITTYEGIQAVSSNKVGDYNEFAFEIFDQKGDDQFVFGKVASELVLPESYLDKFYTNYFGIITSFNQLTYGISKSQKFFTCTTPKNTAKNFEEDLKKQKKMAEKGTFRDSNNKVATVFANDNELVLVRRLSNTKWEATVLMREGIGNDPLYQCWKVDFSRSSLRSSGSAPVEYMLRNEADIINMVMFGPLMGIKFEKTNIEENKCGCTTTTAIVPAN